MIPEQQLIQNIVEIIDNDQLERNPVVEEFAEQYAELCQDIVVRLQRCAEYLDRGMRSAAVHEATGAPSLLELVDVVRFPELRKWANVVADLELAAFPQIPQEIVERLRQECTVEADLAPLLKEYRRFVYQGDKTGSIRVLRRLRERDPQNPSWPQNLKPLEEAQLPALLDAAGEALAAQDLKRLQELYDDLTDAQRAVPAPGEMLERIKDALFAERRAASRLQGTEIAQRLRAALGAADRAAVAAGLADWDRLGADPAFVADPRPSATVAEARAAHEGWERERLAEDSFRAALVEVQDLLHSGKASAPELGARLEALRQTGRQMPESLQAEVRAALAEIAARRQRRRRLIALAVTALCLVAVGAAGLTLWRANTQNRRRTQLTEMTALLEGKNYERLKATLEALKGRDPQLYGSAEVRVVVTAVEEALRKKADVGRQFQGVLAQLALIRDNGYQAAEEQVQALLAEARQIALDEPADRAINAWQSAWEEWRRRRRGEADGEVGRVTTLAQRVIEEKRQRPFTTFADEEKALATLEPALRDAKPLAAAASTETANTFASVGVEVEGWRRDFEKRRGEARQKDGRLQELREQIGKALPDLVQYRTLLLQFTKEFPEAPETAARQRVLTQLEAWTKAEALRAFELPRLPPGPEAEKRLRDLLAAEITHGSVWEADLKAAVAWLDLNETVRQRVPLLAVTTDDSLRLQVLSYRPTGTDAWKLLYHPKPLLSKKETDAQGEFVVYWGLVHFCEADDQMPILIHTSKAFPGGFSTRIFEIRQESRPQDNLVPHGKFLYGFAAEAAEAPELDVHLLHGIQSVMGDPGIEPVPRAWVLKRLVHLLAEHYADSIPESLAMAAAVRDIDTEVPWMNPRHPKTVEAARQCAAVLKTLPEVGPIVNRLQAGRALLAVSLSRQVRCVGWLRQGRDGALAPVFTTAADGAVWVLSAGNPGVPPVFKVVGTRSAAGVLVFKPGLDLEVFEGQILFAPGDGRVTRDVLDGAVPQEFRGQVQRPGAWPVNDWTAE
jgi:hypothetical protein